MAKIRTFICFELSEAIKKELAQLQLDVKKLGRGVRWSNPDDIHLTLKFLGDVEENLITDITEAVKAAAAQTAAFQISISGTGAFPNFDHPRVYWVGIKEASGALVRVQSNIENELQRIGFAKEQRKFSPHLTLGRVKSSDGLKEISAALQKVMLRNLNFLADKIIVMKSELQPGGAQYTPLSFVKLSS